MKRSRTYKLITRLLILIGGIMMMNRCNSEGQEVPGRVNGRFLSEISAKTWKEDRIKQQMATVNKTLATKEREQISGYMKRRGWNMKELSGGIFVWEYKNGDNTPIQSSDQVVLDYSLELINGTVVYDSKTNGPKVFTIDEPGVEPGLNTAVKELSLHSRAKIIIPSHQGFGFHGDGSNIPKSAILIYDVTIEKVVRK